MNHQPDDRSLLARAGGWASSAMTVAVEMVVPVLVGVWLDRRLGLKGPCTILGGVAGLTIGIWSLLRLIEPLRRKESRQTPPRRKPPGKQPP